LNLLTYTVARTAENRTLQQSPLAGLEAMAMIRKGQVQNIGGRDIRAQASFIAGLFQIAA
jgi:hypothetical protein